MSDRVPDPVLMARLQLSIKGAEWVAGLLVPYQDQPVDGGWTPRQQLYHLHQTEEHVHGPRIERTLREERPMFEEWDQEAHMLADADIGRNITDLAAAVLARREQSVALLKEATAEDWAREATWPDGRTVDLAWIAYRALYHGLEHFAALLGAFTALETHPARENWGVSPGD